MMNWNSYMTSRQYLDEDNVIGKKTKKHKSKMKRSPKSSESSSSSLYSDENTTDESDDEIVKHKKKHKKHKKHKKKDSDRKRKKKDKNNKRKKRLRRESSDEEPGHHKDEKGDVWVEVTKEMQVAQTKKEEAAIVGPSIPEHIQQKLNPAAASSDIRLDAALCSDKYVKRRGSSNGSLCCPGKKNSEEREIGLTSEEIAVFEVAGYVMSGTRHKAMEATRLRKENQILTAEEKRLLKTFSIDQRNKKEETVLKQFRDLISSKKPKG
uniref:NF-kappa-B-activating protein C-terminal domain-containing protein n=1 Tax=Meloidogyne enterolobii TaxID=390850 RepID=A0A6V7XGL9_MELEN|nr:unnamed protein product [Meloidogyne enterolobii]